MDPRQSIYLILLLLAALVFGPVIVLTNDHGRERPLRPIPPTERLLDSPASIPRGPSSLPDGRPLGKGPFFPR
jgi:hypothetical protein